ncbi:restriction endonuclease subunit S [Nitrincola tibetensis]|uniref:Restriction endonuclease subunit S n=1 Tax=Nitrincola tibetensis TaxID=2219697 RepID=A0A364NHU4_9GAMM|nr:restriction endonuclease subunit S [Nitrincola tibetensis]RAU16447.1 restriction endonuclease subunit S [Nitrincola tibetensis]
MSTDTTSLEEMCELVVDCPHSTPKWTDSGVIVLRNQNIRDGQLDLSSPSYTDEAGFESRIKRAVPQVGDIVFTREAPMGEVCLIPDGLKCCLGQRQVLLRPKKEVSGQYLYWALQSPFVQHQISWNEGTGTTVSNVRIPVLKALKIPRQGNSEDYIAKILSSLAEKIQLNHQINQTLEQMAQATFKSWFVDFEPVKAKIAARERWHDLQPGNESASPDCYAGELADQPISIDLDTYMNHVAMQAISGKGAEQLAQMQIEKPEEYAKLYATAELFPSAMQDSELGEIPEGWEVGTVSDLLDFNPRRTLKNGTLAPYLDMKNVPTSGHLAVEVIEREMASGTKFINGDTLLARITPCLENGKTAYVDFLNEGETGWGSTEYIVLRPKPNYPSSLGYFMARNESFRTAAMQSMTGTSGRQRANAKAMADLMWLIYPQRIVECFDSIAGSYLRLAKSHGDQSKSLSELRDTLLPKLLSGELSVADIESEEEA